MAAKSKVDASLFEEDDEFEEFPTEGNKAVTSNDNTVLYIRLGSGCGRHSR